MLDNYLPKKVNAGPWITAYTLNRLRSLPPETQFVLPICSLATPFEECAAWGEFVLPPLYHEALDDEFKQRLIAQIHRCFPIYRRDGESTAESPLKVVEVPRRELPTRPSPNILAFSVDTAVEEHGPHLPLATDTIQSYGVLSALQQEREGLVLGRPVDYGHLTWGLPFGFSVDLTPALLTEYVRNYANAVTAWLKPDAVYVVDVHGSIAHRRAIVDGLRQAALPRWSFRWLHEPLAEFASERGDQHAGGVETALVEHISRDLLDPEWWPGRIDDLVRHQMPFPSAVKLTSDLSEFTREVDRHGFNGVVGDILNYHQLDAGELFERMMNVARSDLDRLETAGTPQEHSAGGELW